MTIDELLHKIHRYFWPEKTYVCQYPKCPNEGTELIEYNWEGSGIDKTNTFHVDVSGHISVYVCVDHYVALMTGNLRWEEDY